MEQSCFDNRSYINFDAYCLQVNELMHAIFVVVVTSENCKKYTEAITLYFLYYIHLILLYSGLYIYVCERFRDVHLDMSL